MFSRSKTTSLLAVFTAAALLVAGCGDPDEGDARGEAPQGAAPRHEGERLTGTPTRPTTGGEPTPMPTVRYAPDPVDGLTEESARVAAMRFVEQWAVFSPAPYQGKEFWFSSWEGQATSAFRAQMRVDADPMWEWTWQRRQKACCVEFPRQAVAELGAEGESAVVHVPIRRATLSLDGMAGEIEDDTTWEELLFLVWLVPGNDAWLVDSVDEIPADTELPGGGDEE